MAIRTEICSGGGGRATMAFMTQKGFRLYDEDTGHATYFERPQGFNREVGAFLKEHRP